MRVKAERALIGYKAEVTVPVGPGSPYRTMFMSGYHISIGRGMTPEKAAQRAAAKAEKVTRLEAERVAKKRETDKWVEV